MRFFLTNCAQFDTRQNENAILQNLLEGDKELLDASIKTIFRDCFSFEKSNLTHPYRIICNKYTKDEYNIFKKEFLINFKAIDLRNNLNKKPNGLLTGYYEPAVKAYSYPKKGAYPIYKHPKYSYKKLNYNVTRKAINEGYLKNQNLEIAWVENEIEAFFLQIQGSGRLILEDNKIVKVRFAGSNNQKYTSLGKVLIKHGYLNNQNIDMYKIKSWLYKNRGLSEKYMNMNKRYIFFEEYTGNIKGSGRINLVSNVSLAVDKRHIKKGEAIIIQPLSDKTDLILGIAHDEGIAIKGYNRIDLFTGFGIEAEKKAARLKKKIQTWKLVPIINRR